jgi:hypothetical protein
MPYAINNNDFSSAYLPAGRQVFRLNECRMLEQIDQTKKPAPPEVSDNKQ